MAARTTLFQLLPWAPRLVTSVDESMVPVGGCTQLDNVEQDVRGTPKKRDGIDHDYDNLTTGSASVIGIHDYWFGETSRTQRRVVVLSNGKVYSDSSGTLTELTVAGTAWSGTLTQAIMTTYNNKVIICVDGSSNVTKYWDGNASNPVSDLFSHYTTTLVSVSRASAGTTRTLIFTAGFSGQVGDTIVVSGAGNAAYNGTFTVATKTTTSVANDTITYTGSSSLTEGTTADTGIAVGTQAPKASWCAEHLGRLLLNDKSNLDRFQYSPAFDHTKWGGVGDSGGFAIGQGDGDPDGLNGFVSFKGVGFFGKRNKLYRLDGTDIELAAVKLISDSIGFVSPAAITRVDQDDVIFVSTKGIHSLAATDAYGDFESTYISADIQKTFNDDLSKPRLRYAACAYLDRTNTVGFAFSETSGSNRVNTTTGINNALYLYNVQLKSWRRWPDVSCQSIAVASDGDKKRWYLGTHVGRVSKTYAGTGYDTTNAGAQRAIRMTIKTGTLYFDENPYTHKALKRFVLYYRHSGRHSVTATIKVDRLSLNSENSLSFSSVGSGTPLGTGFVLGSTPLGGGGAYLTEIRHIDGIGRGAIITIEQNDVDDAAELQGFGVEYMPAGVRAG